MLWFFKNMKNKERNSKNNDFVSNNMRTNYGTAA